MRKTLLLLVGMLVIAGAASASSSQPTATTMVSITSTGFNPEDVTVRPGDSVTWKNNDTVKREVVSDTGVFKSPVLDPGETFTHRFDVESSYSYHDGTRTSVTGTINVLNRNVTVGVSRIRLVYGSSVRIFGSIPNRATGEQVTLHITPYGKPTFTRTAMTEEGAYEIRLRPTIRTDVSASWNGTTSQTSPRIGVRPKVVFRTLNAAKNQFFLRVRAAKSYAHKKVRVSRQNEHGVWVTTAIIKLNVIGQARFTENFGPGRTKAQAWVGRSPGYQAGFSVLKIVRR